MNRFELRDEAALSYAELAAKRAETFSLVWEPLDGSPQVVASGPRDVVSSAWRAELAERMVFGYPLERCATIGKAAETSAYALFVAGHGTLRVVAS